VVLEMNRQELENFILRLADPVTRETIGQKGLLKNVAFCDGQAKVTLYKPPVSHVLQEQFKEAVQHAVAGQEGVTGVVVELVEGEKAASAQGLTMITQAPAGGGSGHSHGPGQQAAPGRAQPGGGVPPAQPIPGVKNIIAVGSGKGGVGKSTVAANLALALAKLGSRVGLMDADVYGPSIPLMLHVEGRPAVNAERKILPLKSPYGVDVMSIGFLMEEEDTPVIWRGLMVMKLIQQFLRDVEWGELDYLVVDLPPGTGDVQLTLVQSVPLSGAVIVTTPQDIALLDAKRAFQMFRKVGTPIVGIIENMSYFHCPHCQQRTDIFDHGGGKSEAERRSVPFLGEVPLDMAVRVAGDKGVPIVEGDPQAPAAEVFLSIARKIRGDEPSEVPEAKKGLFAKIMGR
jgi:ATP-binding protein involved in chromosome partitioning